MRIDNYSLIQRCVPDWGFLPIIKINSREVFRGSYKPTAEEALKECQKYLQQAINEVEANQ